MTVLWRIFDRRPFEDGRFRDKEACVPKDITAPVTDPVAVWRQFCAEAAITHNGILFPPPAAQEELFS